MEKTLTITSKNEKEEHSFDVETTMKGQELYEAYVAMTAFLALRLTDPRQISKVSVIAIKDAVQILKEKGVYPEK